MKADFIIRKTSTIVYMSVINFAVTTVLAQILSKYVLPKYDGKKSKAHNFVKLALVVSLIAILAYTCRQISERVPKPPLETATFDPKRVKEVKGSVLTAFTFFMWLGEDVKSFKPLLDMFPN